MDSVKNHYRKYIFNKMQNYVIEIVSATDKQDDFLDNIAGKICKETDIFQIKNNDMTDCDFLELCKKIKILCAEFDVIFLIAQRADIAFLAEADGIHLEPGDINIKSAREILGRNSIIGISAESSKTDCDGADYILCSENIGQIICKIMPDVAVFIKGTPIRKLS